MKRILSILACIASAVAASAQTAAVKTNLLYDATATINAGVEVALAPKWSLDLSGNYNSWTMPGNRKWKHWLAQPEARYWFCDKFAGHFLGVHALGGQCNVGNIDLHGLKFLGTDFGKLKDNRYQGWFAGAGVAYGYAWVLGRHWNLETEIGVGYIYTRYDKFQCVDCGRRLAENVPHNYFGPTKAAINLVYLF